MVWLKHKYKHACNHGDYINKLFLNGSGDHKHQKENKGGVLEKLKA